MAKCAETGPGGRDADEALCVAAHIHRPSRRTPCPGRIRREADSDKEGVTMTMFRSRTADATELFALEYRFPFATTFISLFLVANVGSAVLMLIGQA